MTGQRLFSVVFVSAYLMSGVAQASSTSEMYRTEAMFLLSDENYAGAIGKLDQAVKADTSDVHAHYYRGIALSRSGRYADAATDLLLAQQAGAPYPDLPFELGYSQYRQNQLADAQASLTKAVKVQPGNAGGHYYLALVQYKQKNYAECLDPFATAADLNTSFGASSAYMRAEALTHLNRYDEAEKLLVAGLQAYPDSIYTGPMKELNAKLSKARDQDRWLTMSLGLGLTYDNNVGLFADDSPLPVDIDSGEDYRFSLNGSAGVKLEPAKGLKLTAGYNVFQSQHQQLNQYDVVSHGPYVGIRKDINSSIGLSLNYQFRAAQLDDQDYTDTHVLLPSVAWRHGKDRFSSIRAQWRDTSYQQLGQDGRDGRYKEIAYSHYWLTGKGDNYYLGMKLGMDDTKDNAYDYSSAGLEAGLQRSYAPWKIKARFSFEDKQYNDAVPDREDRHFETGVNAIYPLGKQFELDIGLLHIRHPSSYSSYDYTRTLVTTAVRWRL